MTRRTLPMVLTGLVLICSQAIAADIYFAIRPDKQIGSGTMTDPFDGSYVNGMSRFDAKMQVYTKLWANAPQSPGQNTIHLAQGLYLTYGDDGSYAPRLNYGFLLPQGTKLQGSGIGRTILKLIDIDPNAFETGITHSVVSSGHYDGSGEVVGSGSSATCDGVVVENLTIDCNGAEIRPLSEDGAFLPETKLGKQFEIGGVRLSGSHCTVRNVEVLHALGYRTTVDGVNAEGFALRIVGDSADSTDGLIESCIVDKVAGDYVTSIGIFGGQLNQYRCDGKVRYCTVRDNPWIAYSACATGSDQFWTQFDGNTATNVGYGFRWDSSNLLNVSLNYNTFICTSRAVELSSYGSAFYPARDPSIRLSGFSVNESYFNVPGNGKGFIHLMQNGPVLEKAFTGLFLWNNTFESDNINNQIFALAIDSNVLDKFLDLRFYGGNILRAGLTSTLCTPGPVPPVQNTYPLNPASGAPNITYNGPTPSNNLTLSITPSTSSYTVHVGEPVQFSVSANNSTVSTFQLPAHSYTTPSLPLVGANTGTPISFYWIPSIEQVGKTTISFVAEISGVTKWAVISVNVLSNPNIAAVVWRSLVKTAAYDFPVGSWVEKADPGAANNWDSEAVSAQRIVGDGSVSFRFNRTDQHTLMGLSPSNPGAPDVTPEFAVIARPNGQAQIVENGVTTGVYVPFTTDSVFRISREGGVVKFYKDSSLVRTSPLIENLPLFAECDFYTYSSAVFDCVFTNAVAAEEISWTGLQAMTVPASVPEGGSTVIKTGGASGVWDSEALSAKRITGDGFVSFKFGQTNKTVSMALSSSSPNKQAVNAEFALIARPEVGQVQIVDFLNQSRGYTSFNASDVFRISRQGGVVKYYKNNTLLVTSPIMETLPLVVACDAYDQGGSVTNCIYGGAFAGEQVAWQNTINIAPPTQSSEVGSRLDKNSGGTGWNAEAVSTKRIAGQDGFVQFRFGDISKNISMALTARNRDLEPSKAEFAIISRPFVPELNGPGVQIVEYPLKTIGYFPIATNDSFAIAKEAGVIRYYRNSSVLATSSKVELLPLAVECNIYEQGGFVRDCFYGGGTPFEPIGWQGTSNLVINTVQTDRGSGVIKNGGATVWENPAALSEKILNGDGVVQFQFGPADKNISMGLSSNNGISLAFEIDARPNPHPSNPVDPWVDSRPVVQFNNESKYAPFSADDVFTIWRKGGVIQCYINSTLAYTSTVTTAPIKAVCNVFDPGGYVKNCTYGGNLSSP